MKSESVLESFAADVASKDNVRERFSGIIADLIPVILPIVVELIAKCFEKKSSLEAFAEGRRSALQLTALRLRCNQAAREAGIVGPLRVHRAGAALADGILSELTAVANRPAADSQGDIWSEAIAEANQYA